jgi:hypothetical protein
MPLLSLTSPTTTTRHAARHGTTHNTARPFILYRLKSALPPQIVDAAKDVSGRSILDTLATPSHLVSLPPFPPHMYHDPWVVLARLLARLHVLFALRIVVCAFFSLWLWLVSRVCTWGCALLTACASVVLLGAFSPLLDAPSPTPESLPSHGAHGQAREEVWSKAVAW